MSQSSHVDRAAAVSASAKQLLDKEFSQLITRISTRDCLKEVQPLAAQDLENAFGRVGEALGIIAMEELMRDPKVDKALGEYVDYLSEKDFKPLLDSIGKNQAK